MSQVNSAIAQIERRDLRRVLTAATVVAAMVAVAAYQLRQEAARPSASAPASVIPPASGR